MEPESSSFGRGDLQFSVAVAQLEPVDPGLRSYMKVQIKIVAGI